MLISLLNNSAALAVRRHLSRIGTKVSDSLERLASGKRILRTGDDPAGLALASVLNMRVRGVQQAQRNAMDALSLIQVAEGGLNEVSNIMVRLRELALQSSSDTVSDEERALLGIEFSELRDEMERIAESTRYLGTDLLNGAGRVFTFQVGPDDTDDDRIYFDSGGVDVRASSLGIMSLSIAERDDALDALNAVDDAIKHVYLPRAQLGAVQSRLFPTINNLAIQEENLSNAAGRIEDVDLASESTELVKNQVLLRAGIAVLTQANHIPEVALKLISESPIKD